MWRLTWKRNTELWIMCLNCMSMFRGLFIAGIQFLGEIMVWRSWKHYFIISTKIRMNGVIQYHISTTDLQHFCLIDSNFFALSIRSYLNYWASISFYCGEALRKILRRSSSLFSSSSINLFNLRIASLFFAYSLLRLFDVWLLSVCDFYVLVDTNGFGESIIPTFHFQLSTP